MQKCDAEGDLRGKGGVGGRRGLLVRFKWIALCLVVPNPKHYNTSASDLHLSGAPYTSTRQGTPIVVLVAQSLTEPPPPHTHTHWITARSICTQHSLVLGSAAQACVQVGAGRGHR